MEKNGLLFNNNDRNSLYEAFLKFEDMPKKEINKFKYNAKLKSKEFTVFNHFKKINHLHLKLINMSNNEY